MATKLNVNIRTLLSNCEELAKDEVNYWRLKKFIKSLDTMIDELTECEEDSVHSTAKIPEYSKRLQTLKTLVNYIDSPPPAKSLRAKLRPDYEMCDDALKEMRQLQNSKQYADLRKELLNEDSLRRRKPEEAPTDNMNEAVKYYSEAQEKITEHMLSLTRNLKEQTETANRIIKKDTETVSRSTGMTDHNINSLHKETEKLAEHSRNAWKCWMWMMFAFVIMVFIGMVLFMKIMKKKKV